MIEITCDVKRFVPCHDQVSTCRLRNLLAPRSVALFGGRIPWLSDQVGEAAACYWTARESQKLYICEGGDEMPEVREWRWTT